MKRCNKCGLEKPVELFPKNKRKADGLDIQCKECTNTRIREAYRKDSAKKIAKTRQYHLDHPEWSKKVLREWHLEHAEERYEAYKERGKDPVVAQKRRDATRRSESRRRAIKRNVDAVFISMDDYRDIFTLYNGKCWICSRELTEEIMHWDHYQPLCAGGQHTPENLRPACKHCNIQKNGVWPISEEFLEQIRGEVMVESEH